MNHQMTNDEIENELLAGMLAAFIDDTECLICGRLIKAEDQTAYTGENTIGAGPVSHRRCWEGLVEFARRLGIDIEAAVDHRHKQRQANRPPLGKRPAGWGES